MKEYEGVSKSFLTRRTPVIIRVDGKAFHTFTRGFERPFDMILMETMWETARYLCENIQGSKIAYTQSDEISLLLIDYENINTSAWFDNNIQKMVSISASMATLAFNKAFNEIVDKKYSEGAIKDREYKFYMQKKLQALFDSRVFNLPKEEVCNYFIWRQNDASRNSVQMTGRAYFSHKELHRKSCNEIQEMLFQEQNINWNDLPTYKKRGACIVKEQYKTNNDVQRNRWVVDKDIPIFTQDRDYIERYV